MKFDEDVLTELISDQFGLSTGRIRIVSSDSPWDNMITITWRKIMLRGDGDATKTNISKEKYDEIETRVIRRRKLRDLLSD